MGLMIIYIVMGLGFDTNMEALYGKGWFVGVIDVGEM